MTSLLWKTILVSKNGSESQLCKSLAVCDDTRCHQGLICDIGLFLLSSSFFKITVHFLGKLCVYSEPSFHCKKNKNNWNSNAVTSPLHFYITLNLAFPYQQDVLYLPPEVPSSPSPIAQNSQRIISSSVICSASKSQAERKWEVHPLLSVTTHGATAENWFPSTFQLVVFTAAWMSHLKLMSAHLLAQ